MEVLRSWPEVPADERALGPRSVPVMESLPEDVTAALSTKGWRVVDVRLLSGKEAARAKLEGITLGTIPAPDNIKALELELRMYKLLSDKGEGPKDTGRLLEDKATVDELLSFGRTNVTNVPALVPGAVMPTAPETVRRKGRPKGAKDLRPRASSGPARGVALKSKAQAEGTDQSPDVLDTVPKEQEQ